ncbi:hypothetical protein [Acinetobacter dispersus]|uniref:hypothetical protein n=1 Tax=Acinetobacter dispersus TaxID=70348 RepID=UPI00132EFAC0|nr:hypothetical protein [Acinetobacter dispersus]QHH99235.1 hypothetical protein FPL17_17480 [Acinetobacter dispersus]
MTAMQSLIEQFSNTEDKIIQIGSFQPYELVRVHHNPVDLVLTNDHEHTVAGTTVVLLSDGQARNGLKFKPNISSISESDKSLKVILASTTAQNIVIEYKDYPPKQIDLEANKPAIVFIGELFGIPMLESSANFFDLAVDGQPIDGWSLTNATLSNGVLTYTGGTFEEEGLGGSISTGLFAKKSLNIGESVTVDFKVALGSIKHFALAADNGEKTGTYSDQCVVILQDLEKARLVAWRDWNEAYRTDLNDQTTYAATISRTGQDSVALTLADTNGTVLKERTVTGIELSRIWLNVHFVDQNTNFSASLTSETQK